jgi:NAD(P)-dependent dehydrogenase (short-subunit alcohol dehydrogenase family)
MARGLALVAGGAGAIGQVITRRLVDEGLDVIIIGRRAEILAPLAASSPFIFPCQADLGSDDAIATIAACVNAPVRAVVHSVGVPVAGGVLEAPPEALLAAVNAKVCGLLRLVRAADAHLQKQSRIIAIGGHYGLEPTAYAATAGLANAALLNFCRQLALAYGPRGITAHYIAPGPVETERLRQVVAARAVRHGVDIASVLAELKRESAIGAFTTAEQVAWAVAMLLAPEADAMTGSSLMLDAGRRHGLP